MSNSSGNEKDPTLVDLTIKRDTSSASQNIFSFFIDRIKKTFQPADKNEQKLNGRVQQLNQTAATVIERLKEVKSFLKVTLEPQLFTHVESLIDPIAREVANVQKLFEQKNSIVHQTKIYKKYSSWMIKAELWLELEKRPHDKETIVKTMIMHMMHESNEKIEQDLQVIRDYEEHVLEDLPLNAEEANELQKHLRKEMKPHVLSLEDLMEKQELSSLSDVFIWKDQIDKKRSKLFEKCLQVIDEIIAAISPSSTSEEQHDYLVEVFAQIAFLEEEIPTLIHEISETNFIEPVKRTHIQSKIESFQQELHELNLDLRLTPELVERLQTLWTILDVAAVQWAHKI